MRTLRANYNEIKIQYLMYLNKLLFHPPSSKHTAQNLQGKIIWIPKQVPKKEKPALKKMKSRSADTHKNKYDKADPSPKFDKSSPTKVGKSAFDAKKVVSDSLPREEKKIEVSARKFSQSEKKQSINSEDGQKDRELIFSNLARLPGDNFEIDPGEEPDDNGREINNNGTRQRNSAGSKHGEHDDKKKSKVKGGCLPFLHPSKKKFEADAEGDNTPIHMQGIDALTLERIEALKNQVAKGFVHDSSSESEGELDLLNFKTIFIPNLILLSKFPTKKLLIYFHANNEDLSTASELLERLQSTFMVNVLAVEYPGYGLYKGKLSARKLLIDATTIYKYLLGTLKVEEKDIILFGRSIGTGAACHLAATQNPAFLILLSPFTSIRAVAKHFVGRFGQYLIKERFKNIKLMSEVTCPTIFIHGKKDTVIPSKHSQKLYDACKAKVKQLVLRDEMTHNEFDFYDDLSVPTNAFLKKNGWMPIDKTQETIAIPLKLYENPHL